MLSRLATLLALVAVLAMGSVAASASAAPPSPNPGDPGCIGRDTANFAQDWKSFPFEPSGVARLAEFYGATNPTDWLKNDRLADCGTSP
jgi:hypothetical protein